MKNSNFTISCNTDAHSSDTHTFCQIELKIDDYSIGDQEAWSVTGLMIGAISDVKSMLSHQRFFSGDIPIFLRKLSSKVLFEALYSWQWGTGEWGYESECALSKCDVKMFNALPLGSEIFDGESAFLVLIPNESSRFVWRDYESKSIQERPVDFDQYLLQWGSIKKTLTTIKEKKDD